MEQLIEKLKNHVKKSASNTDFIHHDWFVKYHLEIMERIALELCDRYPEADRNLVQVLVWVHDYAKILDKENEHDERLLEESRKTLLELGFESEFTDRVVSYLSIFKKKKELDLHDAAIEIKIASSADGASHLVGPFWAIYYKENHTKTIEELMTSNIKKLQVDWNRKIVLPEVTEAFLQRNKFVNEQSGIFPDKFLK